MTQALPFHGEITYKFPGDWGARRLSFETGDMTTNGLVTLEFICRPAENRQATLLSVHLHSDQPVEILSFWLESPENYNTSRIQVNGFQSWSSSGWKSPSRFPDRLKRGPLASLFKLDRYGQSMITTPPWERGGHLSWHFTAVDYGGPLSLWGSLSETEGYTLFRHRPRKGSLRVIKDCLGLHCDGSFRLLELFHQRGQQEDVWDSFARESLWEIPPSLPRTGWCSWYQFYNKINEEKILKVLSSYRNRKIPLDYFQIDDGYQSAVGDWLESDQRRFPGGMAALAGQIRNSGYKPGIWMAPLTVEKGSKLFRDHKDWLVTHPSGRPLAAGFNHVHWSGPFYSLDILKPQVQDYVKECLVYYRKSGYDLLKADFLYGAAMMPRGGMTRGQIMQFALEKIQQAWRVNQPGGTILGCGVPLGSAAGKVEYLRTGCDVSPQWQAPWQKRLGFAERVSTQSALRSVVTRLFYNQRAFLTDPDVFYLDSSRVSLNQEQRHTLFALTQLAGSLTMTSDDPAQYNPEVEQKYKSQFPHRPKSIEEVKEMDDLYTITFRIDNLSYLMMINLSSRRREVSLPEGTYYAKRHFFRGQGKDLLMPWQTRVFLKSLDQDYTIAGSTELLFPGSEVKTLARVSESEMKIEWHRPILNLGRLYIRLPRNKSHMIINDRNCPVEEIDGIRVAMLPRPLSD